MTSRLFILASFAFVLLSRLGQAVGEESCEEAMRLEPAHARVESTQTGADRGEPFLKSEYLFKNATAQEVRDSYFEGDFNQVWTKGHVERQASKRGPDGRVSQRYLRRFQLDRNIPVKIDVMQRDVSSGPFPHHYAVEADLLNSSFLSGKIRVDIYDTPQGTQLVENWSQVHLKPGSALEQIPFFGVGARFVRNLASNMITSMHQEGAEKAAQNIAFLINERRRLQNELNANRSDSQKADQVAEQLKQTQEQIEAQKREVPSPLSETELRQGLASGAFRRVPTDGPYDLIVNKENQVVGLLPKEKKETAPGSGGEPGDGGDSVHCSNCRGGGSRAGQSGRMMGVLSKLGQSTNNVNAQVLAAALNGRAISSAQAKQAIEALEQKADQLNAGQKNLARAALNFMATQTNQEPSPGLKKILDKLRPSNEENEKGDGASKEENARQREQEKMKSLAEALESASGQADPEKILHESLLKIGQEFNDQEFKELEPPKTDQKGHPKDEPKKDQPRTDINSAPRYREARDAQESQRRVQELMDEAIKRPLRWSQAEIERELVKAVRKYPNRGAHKEGLHKLNNILMNHPERVDAGLALKYQNLVSQRLSSLMNESFDHSSLAEFAGALDKAAGSEDLWQAYAMAEEMLQNVNTVEQHDKLTSSEAALKESLSRFLSFYQSAEAPSDFSLVKHFENELTGPFSKKSIEDLYGEGVWKAGTPASENLIKDIKAQKFYAYQMMGFLKKYISNFEHRRQPFSQKQQNERMPAQIYGGGDETIALTDNPALMRRALGSLSESHKRMLLLTGELPVRMNLSLADQGREVQGESQQRETYMIYDVSGSMRFPRFRIHSEQGGDDHIIGGRKFFRNILMATLVDHFFSTGAGGRMKHIIHDLPFADGPGQRTTIRTNQEATEYVKALLYDPDKGSGGATDVEGAILHALAEIAEAKKSGNKDLRFADLLVITDGEQSQGKDKISVDKIIQMRRAIGTDTKVNINVLVLASSSPELKALAEDGLLQEGETSLVTYQEISKEKMGALLSQASNGTQTSEMGRVRAAVELNRYTEEQKKRIRHQAIEVSRAARSTGL